MQPIGLKLIAALSAVFVWVVVWYLASTLSKSVRKREEDLSRANMKLIRADEEMNKQVLRTTHELKAPFSGMESNIQLLKAKFWAEVPDEVREIIDRIEFRAQMLSRRIKEILELGDLKSTDVTRGSLESVDLKMVIDDSIEEVRERAKGRHITIDNAVSSLGVMGREKQLAMLFGNLISNAVSYSHDGENVEIRAREDGNKVFVSVEDHGIGIKPEAVDFVFDEYYRTKEAAQFNRMSTGLGLAIVKEVALELGLGVKVESELDKGTTFEVCLIKG
jgi:signal transduction histidine kinase